ncbi:hypothetical protein HBA54_21840 [Pelagibius litoralis]|uniref:Uncharacterized protein n=1 Tax=Pelagibius litoralis TaxID=374515 RepID=A0A967F172_9PROT|nr:hypothetical protein [Pelagibius litoralis]NIA71246.1 hypothetical protein [Pelagibius litoralis]
MTVVLKKIIMEKLKLTGDDLSAATVRFDSGQSVILMAAEGALGHIQVIRRSKNRFEVVMDDDSEVEVDAVIRYTSITSPGSNAGLSSLGK